MPPHWPYHGTADTAQTILSFLRVRVPNLGESKLSNFEVADRCTNRASLTTDDSTISRVDSFVKLIIGARTHVCRPVLTRGVQHKRKDQTVSEAVNLSFELVGHGASLRKSEMNGEATAYATWKNEPAHTHKKAHAIKCDCVMQNVLEFCG